MKTKYLFSVGILIVMLFNTSCTSEDMPTEKEVKLPTVTNYNYSDIEIETMVLINNYRKNIGLKALEKINYVSYKSEEHDEYMITNNVVNHDDFTVRSENIIETLDAIKVSENIAYNYDTAEEAFDAWIKSQAHRQNIEGDYTHFGISIRENPVNKRKYYTNIFVKI